MTGAAEQVFEIVAKGGTWKFVRLGGEMHDKEQAFLSGNADFVDRLRGLYLMSDAKFDEFLKFRRQLQRGGR